MESLADFPVYDRPQCPPSFLADLGAFETKASIDNLCTCTCTVIVLLIKQNNCRARVRKLGPVNLNYTLQLILKSPSFSPYERLVA